MIVSLHKGKHKKTECKHYRSISLLNVVRKVYMALLVDRFRKVNEELTEDEEEDWWMNYWRLYSISFCFQKYFWILEL